MNDKKKNLWDNSLNNISERHIAEMADTLYKKSLTDFDHNDFVIVETEKKSKLPIFALVASIIAIIGVVTITGVIISNSGILSTSSGDGNESGISSEYEIPAGTIGKFGYSFASDGSNGIILTSYSGNPTELVIPETIDGHKVVGIQEEFFRYCQALKTLTIPKSIKTIRNVCFDYCESLEQIKVDSDNEYYCSVDGVLFDKGKDILVRYPLAKADKEYIIPDGVSIMEDKAFAYCKYLTSVTVSADVGCVSRYAFLSCEALKSVTLSEGVTGIGDYTFKSCKALEYINIPESVKNIRETAFEHCDALIAIDVADDNTAYCSVDGVLFSESMAELIKYPACKADEYYSIPESVTNIARAAFYNCKKLTLVSIPDGITEIEDYTFYGSYLEYMDIPDGVTSIGDNAFGNCGNFKYISIPDSVSVIGREAFSSCDNLIDIDVDADNQNYCSVDGVLFDEEMYYLIQYPVGRTDTEYTIPDGVTYIDNCAFSYAYYLERVTFPDGILYIGTEAFAECSHLDSVNLPDTVYSIGDYAFKECVYITSVNIPDSVRNIGNGAFSGCRSLKSVNIPNSHTSIGENAFDSHVFTTGGPIIRDIILIVQRVVSVAAIVTLIIHLIRKNRKEKREIAEYYRRKREAKEKSEK